MNIKNRESSPEAEALLSCAELHSEFHSHYLIVLKANPPSTLYTVYSILHVQLQAATKYNS